MLAVQGRQLVQPHSHEVAHPWGPSPRPPEKRDNDDEDHRAGKREVSPGLPLAARRLSNKMVRMFSHHDRLEPPAIHRVLRVQRERSDVKRVDSRRTAEMHNCLRVDSRRTKDMPLHNPCTDYDVPAVAWL
jgi:hypothetical protein